MSSSIISSFKSLNVATAQDYSDHEAIFQASYQYLAKVKEFRDIKAVHNVIVSLINTDRYYKALEFLKQVPEDILQEFPLEKAYIYYKTGNSDAVQELFESTRNSNELSETSKTAMKHVMAQCYYQNGQMLKALSLYHELISESPVDNELDIACNERAIISQIESGSPSVKPALLVSQSDHSYDFVFNEALIELRSNNFDTSLALLQKASSLCTNQNLDCNPADLAAELAPIQLALAYAYQVSGHSSLASSTLNSLDMEGVTDSMTKLIVKTNLAALSTSDANTNYTARELNYKDVLHVYRYKMTRNQFKSMVKNHMLLSYQSNTLAKSSGYCSNSFTSQFAKEFGGDMTPSIIKLLIRLGIKTEDLNNESKWTAVSKKVYKFALGELTENGVTENAVASALLLVFVNTKSAKFDQAIDILEKILHRELESSSSVIHASLFGALINLYEVTKSNKRLALLFDEILKKLRNLTSKDFEDPVLYNFARSIIFKLISTDSDTDVTSIISNLASARSNDECMQSILNGSGTFDEGNGLAAQDDVEHLLDVDINLLSAQIPQTRPSLKTGKNFANKIAKKARKPKFSQRKVIKADDIFDPLKDLDQERWLPLKLRTYYKPSKKELKKKSGGHQGAIELSPAPSNTSTTASNRNKQQQKKKKKGKK